MNRPLDTVKAIHRLCKEISLGLFLSRGLSITALYLFLHEVVSAPPAASLSAKGLSCTSFLAVRSTPIPEGGPVSPWLQRMLSRTLLATWTLLSPLQVSTNNNWAGPSSAFSRKTPRKGSRSIKQRKGSRSRPCYGLQTPPGRTGLLSLEIPFSLIQLAFEISKETE